MSWNWRSRLVVLWSSSRTPGPRGSTRKTPTCPSAPRAGTSTRCASASRRHADLDAVEQEAAARGPEGGDRPRGLVAPGLLQARAQDHLAAHHARKPALLLLRAAEARDRERGHHQAGERRHRRHRAADLFEQQTGGEEAEVAAAEGLGQPDAEQIRARELAPEVEIEAVLARLDRAQPLVRAVILQDLAREVADFLLLFREGKIHRVPRVSALVVRAGRAPSSR